MHKKTRECKEGKKLLKYFIQNLTLLYNVAEKGTFIYYIYIYYDT